MNRAIAAGMHRSAERKARVFSKELFLLLVILAAAICPGLPAFAMTASEIDAGKEIFSPTVGEPITAVTTPALRDLQSDYLAASDVIYPPLPRAALSPMITVNAFNSPILDFDGQSYTAINPPTPAGAVGPDYFVQMVNGGTGALVQIYDKVTGSPVGGQAQLESLATPTSACSVGGGDPLVIYDRIANRWLLSELSGSGTDICIYVSQTPDPAGSYYFYDFSFPSLPDYYKIGVWPDAYYVGANETTYSAAALEREKMLVGAPATSIRFSGETNFLMPAGLDGKTPPPAGTPGLFYTFKDDAFHGGADRLEVFALNADWTTPANSTFDLIDSIPISGFTYTVCGFFNFACIPQPATSRKLAAISEWPMWRLSYRNFETYEALLGDFTVDAGSDLAAIRWFELRRTGGAWELYQEGQYSPDSVHRWLGSAAMDYCGNIAIAYSVSDGSSIYPGLRYAGRLSSDPLGTLPNGEYSLVDGTASLSFASGYYGFTSVMTVDPIDDATFWFTGEWINNSSAWSTRISAVKLDQSPAAKIGATGYATLQLAAGSALDGDIIRAKADSFSENVTFGGTGTVTLEGGYDCVFGTNSRVTEVNGSITFGGNRGVAVNKIVVR